MGVHQGRFLTPQIWIETCKYDAGVSEFLQSDGWTCEEAENFQRRQEKGVNPLALRLGNLMPRKHGAHGELIHINHIPSHSLNLKYIRNETLALK